MKVWISDRKGRSLLLPSLQDWDISHGFGSPCDSFELGFLWDGEGAEELERATELRAEYGGETVFRGRIDEFRAIIGPEGRRCRLSGRGLQALLLDCEAESADYYEADLEYILRRHVLSQGIEDIDRRGAFGSANLFSVESGMSHWGVLAEFADFCCGIRPRFSPEGILIMDGEHGGRALKLGEDTAFTELEYRQDRYGVIGSVKVKKYSGAGEIVLENPQLLDIGGRCHRVINVPKKTSYDSMRYTAAYQIRRSSEDFRKCFVTLPRAFAAFPGDTLELSPAVKGIGGSFLVVASRCRCTGSEGVFTRLEMRRI